MKLTFYKSHKCCVTHLTRVTRCPCTPSMYNLSLPKLCATLLVDPTALLESLLVNVLSLTDFALYCAVPYIVACVDVSERYFGTVHFPLLNNRFDSGNYQFRKPPPIYCPKV